MTEKTDLEIKETLSNIFTRARIKVLKTLHKKTVFSVGELAQILNRDIAAVYRDLKALEKYDIIYLKKDGKNVQPILSNNEISIKFKKKKTENKKKRDHTMDYIG